jgi:hypothetical protein
MSDISGAVYPNVLAVTATQMKGQEAMAGITAAVLKEVMDQQKMMGEAIVNMIQQMPSPDPSIGQTVDISV